MNNEAGQSFFGELACGLAALAFQAPGKQRHEGRVEGTLAEQAAEKIGESKGDEESVGHRAGSQRRRDQDVAGKTQDAADHGQAADGGKGAIELHGG